MKKFLKTIALCLAAVLSLGLFACDKGGKGGKSR